MGGEDDLARRVTSKHRQDQGIGDEGVVDVVFRLIDYQHPLRVSQHDGQYDRTALARGQLADVFVIGSVKQLEVHKVLQA